MSKDEILEALRQHPFTHDMEAAWRESLAEIARMQTYAPDTLLLREGRAADAFFLIIDGLVAIEMFVPERGSLRLQTVSAGEIVGWSWALPPYRWEFDARALTETKALVLDAAQLRDRMHRDCALAAWILSRLLAVVAGRLKATRLQLLDLYAPAPRRAL
ncbi:cyclic nucleotide-binding domain-containing protein [Thermoflexus sp.]|uniref:cyclic nucleotide-binding domain-containing protein n=1 Tax=Thermoflexus sp. TaxID=1969742 RepID=UPI0035E3F881